MMAYNNKLVVALKTNGKVLREFKDTVFINFGSEYSVYLKNLNTVRSIVNIFIDGTNITPNGLVVAPGQEIDLQRSIVNGNLNEGNALKFVERTSNIEKHRGVKLEDGLVRVEFEFEKVVQPSLLASQKWVPGHYQTDYYGDRDKTYTTDTWNGGWDKSNLVGILRGGITGSASIATSDSSLINSARAISCQATFAAPQNDTGITVPGSYSSQKFTTSSWFPTDGVKNVIILKLLGNTADNQKIQQPVTVHHKPKCESCGKQNKAHAKFCVECGTALTLYA